jgi:hypothetical protein
MSYFIKTASANDYAIKAQRLVIPFSIVANATPASKTYSTNLPANMVLSMQGLTAAATAIDSGTNFATPTDSTGTIGILLYGLGTIGTVGKATVDSVASGVFSAVTTVTLEGANNTGVTASGNIAISASGLSSLATTNASCVVAVDYQLLSN